MYTEIEDLTTRIENLEVNNSKRMLVITGLEIVQQAKKIDNIGLINEFLSISMDIDVHIDDYFTIGYGLSFPQVIIVLRSSDDKRLILQNKSLLKDFGGRRKIYINEYYPSTTHDKRKRESEIVQELKNAGDEEAAAYGKGGLRINNVPYRRQVCPPKPAELINIEPDHLDHIFKLQCNKGKTFSQDNSQFIGYAATVHSHDEIKDYYIKFKMIQPSARHIVCAYWVQHDQPCYARDYHDDGEPGAGCVLLQIIKENMLQNTVIFVARKYGGIKMGSVRFHCYAQAARSALGLEEQVNNVSNNHNTPARGARPSRPARNESRSQYPRGSSERPTHRTARA